MIAIYNNYVLQTRLKIKQLQNTEATWKVCQKEVSIPNRANQLSFTKTLLEAMFPPLRKFVRRRQGNSSDSPVFIMVLCFGSCCNFPGSNGMLCGGCPYRWGRDNYPEFCQPCPDEAASTLVVLCLQTFWGNLSHASHVIHPSATEA